MKPTKPTQLKISPMRKFVPISRYNRIMFQQRISSADTTFVSSSGEKYEGRDKKYIRSYVRDDYNWLKRRKTWKDIKN